MRSRQDGAGDRIKAMPPGAHVLAKPRLSPAEGISP
jgi:hypothetical protein